MYQKDKYYYFWPNKLVSIQKNFKRWYKIKHLKTIDEINEAVTFLISSIQKDTLPESTSQAKQTILKKTPTH